MVGSSKSRTWASWQGRPWRARCADALARSDAKLLNECAAKNGRLGVATKIATNVCYFAATGSPPCWARRGRSNRAAERGCSDLALPLADKPPTGAPRPATLDWRGDTRED